MVRDGDTRRSQVRDSSLHVDRVPVHDRRDDQIETGGAIALVLERAVGDPTLAVHVLVFFVCPS